MEEEVKQEPVVNEEVKATEVIENVIDNMINAGEGVQFLTLEQIRAYKIQALEEKLNALPEDSYKRKQLESKIAEKKKRWFPENAWDSKKLGTYHKPKKEEVLETEATEQVDPLKEEVIAEIEQAVTIK